MTLNKNKTTAVDQALEQDTRKSAHELIVKIVDYFHSREKDINEIIFVPLTIFSRVIRIHDAINLLLENGHTSEAAILALTQFELRLDLAYTASNVKHAAAWIEHENQKQSLMSVKQKINVLFDDEDERNKLYSLFQKLSGIKHANPVYSELWFPARVAEDGTISVSTGEIMDDFSQHFANMLRAYSAYQLAWSSQVLNVFTAQYTNVGRDLRRKVRKLCSTLQPFEEQFHKFLEDVISRQKSAFGMKLWKQQRKH